MARTFEINKKDGTNVVPAGASPLTITGLAAGSAVAAGDYVAVAIEDGAKSVPTDIPAFAVPAAEPAKEQETPASTFDPAGEVKPTEANTVDEIKAWLTAHTINFAGKTLKADLLALVPAE